MSFVTYLPVFSYLKNPLTCNWYVGCSTGLKWIVVVIRGIVNQYQQISISTRGPAEVYRHRCVSVNTINCSWVEFKDISVAKNIVMLTIGGVLVKTCSDCGLRIHISDLIGAQMCYILPFIAVEKIKRNITWIWICRERERERDWYLMMSLCSMK